MLGTEQHSSLPSTPTLAWGLIENLLNKGHEISIITNTHKFLPKNVYPLKKVQIYPMISSTDSLLEYAASLFKSTTTIVSQIKKINPDVVHTYGDITMSYFTAILKNQTKKPSITTVTRNWVGYGYPRAVVRMLSLGGWDLQTYTILNNIKRQLIFSLDHIICCNNFVKKQIVGNRKVSKNISVLPYGIKKAFLSQSDPDISNVPKSEGKTILYWGDGNYVRGYYIFLFSIAKVLKLFPKTRFIAAIRGIEDLDSVKLRITAKKIEKTCSNLQIFNKALEPNSLVRLIDSSQIIALPFIINAMEPPLTIIESMALGKPVITTKIGGNNEIISNMENGILIEPNSSQLSEAIISLLKNDSKSGQIGQRAYETIREQYNWDKCTKKVLEIYKKVVN